MSVTMRGALVSVGSRMAHSAVLYVTAWIFGAIFLSALHVLFQDKRHTAPATFPRPSPEIRGSQLPRRIPSPTPIVSGSAMSVSSLEKNGVLESVAWAAAQHRKERWAAYVEYLQKFPKGIHVPEAEDRLQLIEAIECGQNHPYSINSDLCFQDLLINLLGSADKPRASFDWSSLQTRFGKALFAANLRALSLQFNSGVNDQAPPNQYLNFDLLTSQGVLYQFGSDVIKSWFRDDESGKLVFSAEIKPDLRKAVDLYRIAAEAGDPKAEIMLGLAYQTGFGVNKDSASAIKFFKVAGQRVKAASLLEEQADLMAATSTR